MTTTIESIEANRTAAIREAAWPGQEALVSRLVENGTNLTRALTEINADARANYDEDGPITAAECDRIWAGMSAVERAGYFNDPNTFRHATRTEAARRSNALAAALAPTRTDYVGDAECARIWAGMSAEQRADYFHELSTFKHAQRKAAG